jgi:hypothetical protein
MHEPFFGVELFFLASAGDPLLEGVEGDCLEAAGRDGFGVVGKGLSGLESRRLSTFVISPSLGIWLVLFTDMRSVLLSFSVVPLRPSPAGLAAIHRSSQLQPQCGLFGSTNIGFVDLELLFHCQKNRNVHNIISMIAMNI